RSRITSGPSRSGSARSARHPRKTPPRPKKGARRPRKKGPRLLPPHHHLLKCTHRRLSRTSLAIARMTKARQRPKMTPTRWLRERAAAPKHATFAVLEQRELRLEARFPSERANPPRWLVRGFVRKHERSPMN